MKLRAQREGLAIAVTLAYSIVKDQLVKISGDNTVAAAGSNDFVVGRVTVPYKGTSGTGIGTVECIGRVKEKIEIKNAQGGALAAGDFLKMAAVDGTTGEPRVAKFVPGTDDPTRLIGICIKGAADAAVIEALTF